MFISIFIKALFALMIILFYAFVRSSPNNHEDEEYLDELDLFQKKFTTDKGRVYYRYRAEIKNKLNASFKTTSYELYQKWGLFSTIKIDLDEFDALILIISDDPELKERLQDNSYRLAHIILILFKKYPDI
jgi:hypothetical protein